MEHMEYPIQYLSYHSIIQQNIEYYRMHDNTIVSGYTILWNEEIGMGNFATVYKCIHNQSKITHAVKILQKITIQMDENLKQLFENQISSLQITSQHIVQFIQLIQCKTFYYIILQLCDYNLREYITNNLVNEKQAIRIFTQISIGLKSLSESSITHRDLKPQNILLKNGKVKIADFGVSKKQPHHNCKFEQPAGSIIYMPLEGLKGQVYTSKCDIWSVGLILYELIHHECPWYRAGDTKQSLVDKIHKNKLTIKSSIDPNIQDILKKCLTIDEDHRIQWVDYFAHPIFNNIFKQYVSAIHFRSKLTNKTYTELKNLLKIYNISLTEVIGQLSIHTNNIDFISFYKLLRWVNDNISQPQANYIFQQTDYNGHGFLTINQIQKRMSKYVTIENKVQRKLQIKVINTNIQQSQQILQIINNQNIKIAFKKANIIIKLKNQSLQLAFNNSTDNKMKMNKSTFTKFINKYLPDLKLYQINQIYNNLAINNIVQFQTFSNLFNKMIQSENGKSQKNKQEIQNNKYKSVKIIQSQAKGKRNKIIGQNNLCKMKNNQTKSYHYLRYNQNDDDWAI